MADVSISSSEFPTTAPTGASAGGTAAVTHSLTPKSVVMTRGWGCIWYVVGNCKFDD